MKTDFVLQALLGLAEEPFDEVVAEVRDRDRRVPLGVDIEELARGEHLRRPDRDVADEGEDDALDSVVVHLHRPCPFCKGLSPRHHGKEEVPGGIPSLLPACRQAGLPVWLKLRQKESWEIG